MHKLGGCLTGTFVSLHLLYKYRDDVLVTDHFSKHISQQQKKHFVSGMYEPFVAPMEERIFFDKHFAEYSYLLPSSYEDYQSRRSVETPIMIKPLSAMQTVSGPINTDTCGAAVVAVGGPPALISQSQHPQPIVYINDNNQYPISYASVVISCVLCKGSAYHLEWDAATEAPSTTTPIQFMIDQIVRAIWPCVTLRSAQTTGNFPWMSINWVSWLLHPEKWLEGLKLAYASQLHIQEGRCRCRVSKADGGPFETVQDELLADLSSRCKANERFYTQLHKDVLNTLTTHSNSDNQIVPSRISNALLVNKQGNGSIIIATTDDEVKELYEMKENLNKEQRKLSIVNPKEFAELYGFSPSNGLKIGIKHHDRILNPYFHSLITRYIQVRGSSVLDAKVTAIYTDDPQMGGYVEYICNSPTDIPAGGYLVDKLQEGDGIMGHERYKYVIPFSRCILSLGCQRLINAKGCAMVDMVSARGVSGICIVKVPRVNPPITLPPAALCGATNDMVVLAGPVSIDQENRGQEVKYDAYVVKITAGACISPTVQADEQSTYFDGVQAVGLVTAIKRSVCHVLDNQPAGVQQNTNVGDGVEVQVLSMMGCNRQVNCFGQGHWYSVEPKDKGEGVVCVDKGVALPSATHRGGKGCDEKGVFVLVGAAGGGLTQAPSQQA